MKANRNPFSLVTRFSAAFFLAFSSATAARFGRLLSGCEPLGLLGADVGNRLLPSPVADDAIHLEPVGLQICIDLLGQFCRNLSSGVRSLLHQSHQLDQTVVKIEERAMVAVGLTDYAAAQCLNQAGGLFPCRIGKLTLDTFLLALLEQFRQSPRKAGNRFRPNRHHCQCCHEAPPGLAATALQNRESWTAGPTGRIQVAASTELVSCTAISVSSAAGKAVSRTSTGPLCRPTRFFQTSAAASPTP